MISNKNLTGIIPENVPTSKQYRLIVELTEIYQREILVKADNNICAAKLLLIRVSPCSNKFPIIPGKCSIEIPKDIVLFKQVTKIFYIELGKIVSIFVN